MNSHFIQTRFAPVFSDHAVLQQGKPVHVWGSISPEKEKNSPKLKVIEICLFADESSKENLSSPNLSHEKIVIQATIEASRFRADLPAMEAGGPYHLTLLENQIPVQTINDIMIGEVWLAGGQSNMEYELQNDADARVFFHAGTESIDSGTPIKGSVASSSDSNKEMTSNNSSELSCGVRFFQVKRKAYFDEGFEEEEAKNHWMTTENAGLGTWSAVAYYFARELSEKLSCTVGIIGCNWGGTSASAWQSRESLLSHPETAIYWEEYDQLLQKQDPEEYEKERQDYLRYQENWQPKINAFYEKNPSGSWEEALAYAGPCLWPGPMGPKHEFRPAGLYETMLKRVTPYSLRGFLYYQGESDDHRPGSYQVLLQSLIAQWRKDFEDETLSFLNVQLPMHRYKGDAPSDSWAVIRQAQERTWRKDPYSGLAVIIDQGEFDNIHPTHKKEVGHRLFLQSMFHPYHRLSREEVQVPFFQYGTYFKKDHEVILHFENVSGGFDCERYFARRSCDQSPFEYSLGDGGFVPFTPEFLADGQSLRLDLPKPVSGSVIIRYLWTNYAEVDLFDHRGLPLAPFRTELSVP